MARQRATGRKRRPRDTVASTINVGAGTALDLTAHENAYNPHNKNFWKGDWTAGTYQPYDQVLDQNWLMIANKITEDRAAPQPVGNPEWLLPTAPVWEPQNYTGIIYTGIEIKPPSGFLYAIETVRVWIPDNSINAHYRVIFYDTITGQITPGIPFLGDISPTPNQWIPVSISPTLVSDQDDFALILESYNSSATTDFNHPWLYTGASQTAVDPGTGNINRDNQQTVLRINNTDDDGADRTAQLQSVIPGTLIRVADEAVPTVFYDYTVLDPIDNGTWHNYSVVLTDSAGGGPLPATRCTVSFQVPVVAPTDYVRVVDQWLGDDPINGFIALDDINNVVLNDNAYGIDLQFQDFLESPDWDAQAFSSGFGTAGGASAATRSVIRTRTQQLSGTWFARWLPAELDRLADGNEGSVWPPGPPPTALQVLRINQFVAYTSSPMVNLGDSHLWQELQWLEAVQILDPGRAAILIQPP